MLNSCQEKIFPSALSGISTRNTEPGSARSVPDPDGENRSTLSHSSLGSTMKGLSQAELRNRT
jgi:hypothetical protein